jgi:hypothetical protein
VREIQEVPAVSGVTYGVVMIASAFSGLCGAFIGAYFFPDTKTTYVEKPVEVVRYVDRIVERRVEVPVIRQVEVPFEKIVEKRVEVPVEKLVERRVEVPIEKIVYRLTRDEPEPLGKGHLLLRVGMRKAEVLALVGRPYFDDGNRGVHFYSVFSRMNLQLRFIGDVLAQIIRPK